MKLLPTRDAAELTWYLLEGHAIGLRSPTAVAISRAELYPTPRREFRRPERPDMGPDDYEVSCDPTRHLGTPDFDDEHLLMATRVSRQLERVGQAGIGYEEALTAWYGPWGERVAMHPLGRVVAVMPITAAGQRLIARGLGPKTSTSSAKGPLEKLLVVLEANDRVWLRWRANTIDSARETAVGLVCKACLAWQSVKKPK